MVCSKVNRVAMEVRIGAILCAAFILTNGDELTRVAIFPNNLAQMRHPNRKFLLRKELVVKHTNGVPSLENILVFKIGKVGQAKRFLGS